MAHTCETSTWDVGVKVPRPILAKQKVQEQPGRHETCLSSHRQKRGTKSVRDRETHRDSTQISIRK